MTPSTALKPSQHPRLQPRSESATEPRPATTRALRRMQSGQRCPPSLSRSHGGCSQARAQDGAAEARALRAPVRACGAVPTTDRTRGIKSEAPAADVARMNLQDGWPLRTREGARIEVLLFTPNDGPDGPLEIELVVNSETVRLEHDEAVALANSLLKAANYRFEHTAPPLLRRPSSRPTSRSDGCHWRTARHRRAVRRA